MKKLLYIKCSPRGTSSKSTQIADAYLPAYKERYPDAEIEELDLFELKLPEFDGDAAASKMSFFGEAPMDGKQQTLYDEMVRLFKQFDSADDYLFSIPMWNFGVPWKLKLYIDLLSMPGTLFGFDPAEGYSGLLKNKRATAVYSAAIYSSGVPKQFGTDHASTHFTDWLNFAGIDDVSTIWYEKYKMIGEDEANAALEQARENVRVAAQR
jgi:FMN-dependent NADH-azoreductase